MPRSTSGSSRRHNAASGVRKGGAPAAAGANRLTAASIAAPADGGDRGRSASPVTGGRRKDRSSQSARLAAGAGSFFEAVSSGWFGSGGGQGK